jgi:hypothetical protein
VVTRQASSLGEPFGESWRIAAEGHPPTAKRCQCSNPMVFPDEWEVRCVACGREPAIRLGPRVELRSRNGAAPRERPAPGDREIELMPGREGNPTRAVVYSNERRLSRWRPE